MVMLLMGDAAAARGYPPAAVTRALVIEDDRKLAALVVEFLGQHGVEATIAPDGAQALSLLAQQKFDILLVDLMLPGMDGLTLTRKIRERFQTPVIMVTARGDDADKIVGLELGADDYLAKPFNPRELLARIRAVLRRSQGEAPPELPRFTAGGLEINFGAREVTVDGKRQTLTAHEYEILSALARNAGRVLSRDQLLELVKGDGADEAFDRSIDVHVSRLRQKIEPDPRHPRYVKTVRGAGYLLTRDG
jgi:DNA-binding response OmpR family regulator